VLIACRLLTTDNNYKTLTEEIKLQQQQQRWRQRRQRQREPAAAGACDAVDPTSVICDYT